MSFQRRYKILNRSDYVSIKGLQSEFKNLQT